MVDLKIIPSYKCDIGCTYCKMNTSHKDVELNIDDILLFIDRNKNDINLNNGKLLTGEDWLLRKNWIDSLTTKFNKVTLVTKLINDDLGYVTELCNDKRLELIISFTNINRLENVLHLKKYIKFVDVVLTNSILDDLYEIIKWTTENHILLHITPEVTDDKKRAIDYDKLSKVIVRADSEIGLMNLMNYTDILLSKNNKVVEQVTIDPTGRLYSCTMNCNIHGVQKEESEYNIYKNSIIDIKNKCYKNTNHQCKECSIQCEGLCGEFTGVSFQNICALNKILNSIKPSTRIISPHQIMLTLTYACNLSCKYCFEKDRNREFDGMMSVNDAINMIKYMNRTSLYHDEMVNISLFGGEPTLNLPVIKSVIDFLKTNRVTNLSFMVQTNLFNLTDEILELFREMHNLIKTQIVVSLDGDVSANCHRLHNGESTFITVVNNIRMLKDSIPDIDIHLCAVMTSEVINTFEESVDIILTLKDVGLISGFTWAHVNEITDGFELSEEDISKLSYTYHKKVRPKLVSRPDFEELEDLFGGLRLGMNFGNNISGPDVYKFYTCNYGNSTIAVVPNGRIIPCYQCVNKYFKNEHEVYVSEFGKPILQSFGDICMDPESLHFKETKCKDCPLVKWCNWCPVVNLITSNHSSSHEQYYKSCMRLKLLAKYNLRYSMENLETEILRLTLENNQLIEEIKNLTN